MKVTNRGECEPSKRSDEKQTTAASRGHYGHEELVADMELLSGSSEVYKEKCG